jgi:hypothetical protein
MPEMEILSPIGFSKSIKREKVKGSENGESVKMEKG